MPESAFEPPYYPMIYVRGYAGSEAEVEDTVADPYMGFNLGATKLRQTWTGKIQRMYFESPLVRLMKDYGYRDVYTHGDEMPPEVKVVPRSLFIFRYYDQVSEQLGVGKRPEIEDYARDLGTLILSIRDRMCADCEQPPESFRVYLLAHSMGGLICRCLLQHPDLGPGPAAARALVAKVFTYATPHNGIDLQVIGNVPGFFSRNNSENFNRDRMAAYLGLPKGSERVDGLGGAFDPSRFFCLVGTNARDYDVGGGAVRRLVGPLSDGLVRIENATVQAAPRAFVHRSHSGHFGIVNSEEGFQNLTRFFFGDVRVDGLLQVEELTLPPKVDKAWKKEDRKIRASYHFEVVVKVRGARWDLHRRQVSESSAIFRTFEDMFERPEEERRHPYLFSQFLRAGARVNPRRRSLGFSIELRVQVPEYEIDGRLWLDDHYEGGNLYNDKVNLEAIPPTGQEGWRLRYGFDSRTPNRTSQEAETLPPDQAPAALHARPDDLVFRIPIAQSTRPGMRAHLLLCARPV